jgi:hypothetical protein
MTPNDDPNANRATVPGPTDPRAATSAAARPGSVRGWAFPLAALVLAVVSGLAGTGLARRLREPKPAPPLEKVKSEPELFAGWTKPDLVILLSGEQHGYLLPCGCSSPQIGGLERRYNLARQLRQRGWPLAAVDLGDVLQVEGPLKLPNVQGLIKYQYSMTALKKIGYGAVGIGESEAAQDLFQTVGKYALNEPEPRVLLANLIDPDKVYEGSLFPWAEIKPKDSPLKVGVTAVVGPSVAKRIKDPKVRFGPTPPVLDAALKALDAGKVDLRVLLYQGRPAVEAKALAETYPQFPVILCRSDDDNPSSDPLIVTNPKTKAPTMIVTLGDKGKYVGVVGVWRTGKADRPFDLRYQLVHLSPDFATPKGEEASHPIVELMEAYTRELKKDNYLAKYPRNRHPHEVAVPGSAPTYVGTEACKKCHESAYDIWKKTPHSHAYQTLVDARRPSLRQYDPECIVCHTVGFGYQSGFAAADKTPFLKNVGCESCHGPASEHVSKPKDERWHKLMNPWKAPEKETDKEKTARINRIDLFCQRCHDLDNDVTWKHGAFERKWPRIVHHTFPD